MGTGTSTQPTSWSDVFPHPPNIDPELARLLEDLGEWYWVLDDQIREAPQQPCLLPPELIARYR